MITDKLNSVRTKEELINYTLKEEGKVLLLDFNKNKTELPPAFAVITLGAIGKLKNRVIQQDDCGNNLLMADLFFRINARVINRMAN